MWETSLVRRITLFTILLWVEIMLSVERHGTVPGRRRDTTAGALFSGPRQLRRISDDSYVGQKRPGVGTGCWDRADGRPLGSPCYAGVAHGLDEGGRSHPAKGACGRKAPFKGPMDQRGLGAPPLTEEWDKGLQQRRPRGRACATPTLQGGCDAPDADRTPPPAMAKAPTAGLRPRGLSSRSWCAQADSNRRPSV